jgi:leader peptidase (prepilin peptidase)/N-methyltransferase
MFCEAWRLWYCYNIDMLIVVLIIVIGWFVGILVNYLADILPFKRRIGLPVCDKCGNNLSIIKYFSWKKECPTCGQKRSLRNWFLQLFYIFVALWLWFSPIARIEFIPGLILLAYFGVVTAIDIEHRVILHPVSIFGVFLGLVFGFWKHDIFRTMMGGAVGFLLMLCLYYLGILVVHIRAIKHPELKGQEALGFGDVNLGGVLGLILGWPGILAGLIIAILTAGAASFVYILVMIFKRKYSANLAIPYGPFLVIGAAVLLFYRWY